MAQSKEWDWSSVEQNKWIRPSEDSIYLAKKWQEEGVHSILDLGCGRGRHALYFTQKGFRVTAVDLSAEAIEFNKRMQKEQGVDYLCKRADMMKLPFADDAFDRVFS
jgi:cyclopropane fatty-acyl-phospholipid synthase-like methyltransferase